jgi:hypothetical protein
MNIFILDTDPRQAARYLCDQHLNKMILESAQMLSTVVHLKIPGKWNKDLYKPTQPNHPCIRWLLEDQYNCEWLWKHVHEMEMERGYRWPLRALHASSQVAAEAMNIIDDHWYGDSIGRTQFARVVPAHIYQCGGTITEAYQRYYREKNRDWFDAGKQQMKWTKREVPPWFLPTTSILQDFRPNPFGKGSGL